MQLKIDGQIFNLSNRIIQNIRKYFNINKYEAHMKLFENYPEIYDQNEILICPVTGEYLFSRLTFTKNKFINKQGLLKHFSQKIEDYYLNLLKISSMWYTNQWYTYAYIDLLKEIFPYTNITLTSIQIKSKELFSGENSPRGKYKKRNEKAFYESNKKISEKAIERFKDKSKNNFSSLYWIEKGFSTEDAIIKTRNRNKFTLEYWENKGYSKDEAKLKALEANPSTKNNIYGVDLFSLSPLFTKYWIDRGYTENQARRFIRNFKPASQIYWIRKGFSKKEASFLAKQQNPFLKEFWEKRGLKKTEIIEILSKQRQNSLIKLSSNGGGTVSKESKIFFTSFLKKLKTKLKEEEFIENIKTPCLGTGEKLLIKDKFNKFYDFCDETKKLIIEYNGSLFHANPKFFKEGDTPNFYRKNTPAKQIWDEDEAKRKIAEEAGYTVEYVWDSDSWNKKINFLIKTYYL